MFNTENKCRKCGESVEEVWRKCGESVEKVWRKCGESVEEVWRKCGDILERFNVIIHAILHNSSVPKHVQLWRLVWRKWDLVRNCE